MSLVWTKDPPRVPGRYFVRYENVKTSKGRLMTTDIVTVGECRDYLGNTFFVMSESSLIDRWKPREYAGPIEEPEEALENAARGLK